jgi:hypothetical protein
MVHCCTITNRVVVLFSFPSIYFVSPYVLQSGGTASKLHLPIGVYSVSFYQYVTKKEKIVICDTITSCVMNVLGLVLLNKKEEEEEY